MTTLTEKQLKELLVNPRNAPHNHFVADCPFCDKTGHFYINKGVTKKGIIHGYDCKKCGVAGSVFTFLAKLNALYLIEGRQVVHDKLTKLEFEENEQLDSVDIVVPDKKLPIGAKPIVAGSDFYTYLQSRKFQEIDFEYYQPHQTKIISKFKDYVIIPVLQDYSIKGYVTRYAIDKKDSRYNKEALRYLNAKNVNFGCLLSGIDEVNQNTNTAILVEGFFDKISVTTELGLHYIDELKCLCTFGKKISTEQIKLIRKTKITTLILMYDERDAVNDMKKISQELKKYFNVLVASTGDNDPGDCTKQDFLMILDDLKSPDEFWLDKIQKKQFK